MKNQNQNKVRYYWKVDVINFDKLMSMNKEAKLVLDALEEHHIALEKILNLPLVKN